MKNSLLVASVSVVLSILMSVAFIFFTRKKYLEILLPFSYATLAVPEIVLAIGLLSFFIFFSVPLGITTLIAGHTLIGLAYAIPIMYGQYQSIDKRLQEASSDLGATEMQTLLRVIFPLLLPSIISSALLVFIISLDDFVFSFFCSGSTSQTLPLYIFAMIRSGASPMINALSTLLLVVSSLVVLVLAAFQSRNKMERL